MFSMHKLFTIFSRHDNEEPSEILLTFNGVKEIKKLAILQDRIR
jgi:hypothetical protein